MRNVLTTTYDSEVLQLFRSCGKTPASTALPKTWAPDSEALRHTRFVRVRGFYARTKSLQPFGLLQAFLDQIGLKGSLKTFGIPEGELPALAKQSMALPDYTNNPKVPTPEDICEVLARSF